MAYLLSNICTTNYWNRTTIVKIVVGGWVVSFLRHSVFIFLTCTGFHCLCSFKRSSSLSSFEVNHTTGHQLGDYG